MTSQYLATPFVTAVLLTGSAERAETAMLEGIRSWDADADPDEELLRTTVSAALDLYRPQRQEEITQASFLLPVELRGVLQLPPDLRQCYVLRLLMGLPRESCARMLGVDAGAVDRDTGLAAQALAQAPSISRTITPSVSEGKFSNGKSGGGSV
jgi:DNA-directed RNA polymerase specialized sigma24 family protein